MSGNAAVMWGSFALIALALFLSHLPFVWTRRERNRRRR